jgi:serine/threonine protein kinase
MAKQGLLSGQTLAAGKYQLGEILGSGGMGAVYKAQDTRLHRSVAVKVMSPQCPVSPADLQQFTRLFQAEALRLANLKHPSIPHIYDHFDEAGRWFLVMEFIEGETLKDYLEQRGRRLPIIGEIGALLP